MKNKKDLILFIPGMGERERKEPEGHRERLVAGIREYCEEKGMSCSLGNSAETSGDRRSRIEVQLEENHRKAIDVQELYWGDLRPFLSSETALRKVVRGLSLLLFWTTSRKMWKQALHSRYMLFNIIATTLLMLGWYYGVLAVAASAIGATATGPEADSQVLGFFQVLGKNMGSWYVWGLTSLLIGILPVTAVVDISYAAKCYLQNQRGLYRKIRSRVKRALILASQSSQDYDRVTVVAHSFGVIICVEALAMCAPDDLPDLRLVTLGGALRLIAARSERVRGNLDKTLANEKVETWIDFYSDSDWLCTRSPVPEEVENYTSRVLATELSLDEKVSGKSHSLYFSDWDVMETLMH